MAGKSARKPERNSPKHLILRMIKHDEQQYALLDCGHTLTGRKLWPGKARWCPTCNPPRPVRK